MLVIRIAKYEVLNWFWTERLFLIGSLNLCNPKCYYSHSIRVPPRLLGCYGYHGYHKRNYHTWVNCDLTGVDNIWLVYRLKMYI